MKKSILQILILSFSSQVSPKYMDCNALLNSLQNVVVSSTFIVVFAFLTGGSFLYQFD